MQLMSHNSLGKWPEKSTFVFASLYFCCHMLLKLLERLQVTLQLLAKPNGAGVVIFHLCTRRNA